MMVYSSSASSGLRLRFSTRRVSSSRPRTAYQRGESGTTNSPAKNATAGIAAIASIQRHTFGSSMSWSRTAFMTNASNCPVTIMSSLIVTIRPRMCTGAISARYSGTVADAAPTPKPSTIRKITMMTTFGAMPQPSAPIKKAAAQTNSAPLRPKASAILPPTRAPTAAPGNSSELTTTASLVGVRLRSSCIYKRAPEITPVS
jgi:hypothetical protein